MDLRERLAHGGGVFIWLSREEYLELLESSLLALQVALLHRASRSRPHFALSFPQLRANEAPSFRFEDFAQHLQLALRKGAFLSSDE